MATKKTLERKLAKLESINDQLMTEIDYVDHLMKLIGFAGGLQTLKETATELYNTNGELDIEMDDEGEDYEAI